MTIVRQVARPEERRRRGPVTALRPIGRFEQGLLPRLAIVAVTGAVVLALAFGAGTLARSLTGIGESSWSVSECLQDAIGDPAAIQECTVHFQQGHLRPGAEHDH